MSADSVHAETVHQSVMENEVAEYLRADETRVSLMFDGTFGGGGHSQRMLQENPRLLVVACDRDDAALTRGAKRLSANLSRLNLSKANYSEVEMLLQNLPESWRAADCLGEQPRFARVLLDLGISSDQLDDPSRGFSFKNDQELDMRMDRSQGRTAAEILNAASFAELRSIFVRGGLRERVRELSDALIQARPLTTAREVAAVCEKVYGTGKALRERKSKAHPATVPFQALRIAVNDEFGELERFLGVLPRVVEPGARCAFISFHSLEDRLVTKALRAWAQPKEVNPTTGERRSLGRLLTKKALLPQAAEMERNSRARSARMRVFEFGEEPGLWQ